MLCLKIRKGLQAKVETARIRGYVDWFITTHLLPHFEAEEQRLFPLLPADHPSVTEALRQHQSLRELFGSKREDRGALERIAEELDAHVRFEERILFQEIQSSVPAARLDADELHPFPSAFCEKTDDEFWKG